MEPRRRDACPNTENVRRGGLPGRHEQSRAPVRPRDPDPTVLAGQPVLSSPVAVVLRELLGPMRWLGAPKGSDLSEALGGMPGDAGWLLQLPKDGGLLCITVSRRLCPAHQVETRVVLFQQLRGYGGLTWCLAGDDAAALARVRAEVRSLLEGGATVVRARPE